MEKISHAAYLNCASAGAIIAPKQPQVQAAIDYLFGVLNEAECSLALLIERLGPVLSEEALKEGEAGQNPSVCEISNRIDVAAVRIRVIRQRVDGVLSRLEI